MDRLAPVEKRSRKRHADLRQDRRRLCRRRPAENTGDQPGEKNDDAQDNKEKYKHREQPHDSANSYIGPRAGIFCHCLIFSEAAGFANVSVRFGMLRDPHVSTCLAERQFVNDFKSSPFVPSINSGQALSQVEGLRADFSAACSCSICSNATAFNKAGESLLAVC